MRMMTVYCVGILAASAWAQGAGDLTDPVEILKKVDAAALAVQSAGYSSKVEADGQQGKMAIEAKVVVSRKTAAQPEKYRVEAKYNDPRTSEDRNVIIGSDGETYYLIDHVAKKVYADIDPAVTGSSRRILETVQMQELTHATPFTDEIKAEKHELKGSAKVGDEDCYDVVVKYGAGFGLTTTWKFSKKDFLPRQRDDLFEGQGGGPGGARSKVLSNFVLNPKFEKDPFTLVVPEGYTKVDDFAP